MTDMLIAIPSRGRAGEVVKPRHTLTMLHPDLFDRTILFVPTGEVEEYTRALESVSLGGVSIESMEYSTIGEKRQMMAGRALELGYRKVFMVDDDINFLVRRAPDNWQLRYTEADETLQMYNIVSRLLENYSQVSLGAREGNNRLGLGGPADVVECTRGMRANAFWTEEFLELEHGRVDVMEDFDITLQLLRQGRPTAVTKYWATGQKATNTAGGCSVWRTHEIHERSVSRLADLHPGLVRLRQKNNKGGGEFGTRTEATISWKEAYKMGLAAAKRSS